MKNEQEIVRTVFDAYIRDIKAINKKHEPTIDMLEEVKNRAIKALGQNTVSEEVYNDEYTARKQAEYELWKIKEQQECEDSVSRADVFQMMKDIQDDAGGVIGYYTYDRVKNLPPVVPAFPKNVTNGDIIMAMFPNAKIEHGLYGITGIPLICLNLGTRYDVHEMSFVEEWWNAPYKKAQENEGDRK